MHLLHPVAQAVHDELNRPAVQHIQAVSAAGEVNVVARVVGIHPVVRRVVDAAQAQGGAEVVPLASVVVDHVEDHLDAGAVEPLDHRLELGHLLAAATRGVARVRGKEADRMVAPVIGQALLHEMAVHHELVDGHQLDRRHAQIDQMIDDRVGGHAQVRAAQLLGHVGVSIGQSLDVALVDHGVVPGRLRVAIVAPGERGIHNHGLGHERRTVAGIPY